MLKNWRGIAGDEGDILKSINKHGHIGNNLNPASISKIPKKLKRGLNSGTNERPFSGRSFRVGAALDLLEQGEPLDKVINK
ncbi:hypothetical protein N9M31_03435 [Alphaproteobacteria bacterium]|nr:hypothetical protein [Alphaproteobacteria bacterium]